MKSIYTVQCGRIRREVEVDYSRLSDTMQEKVIQYGLNKKLNDGMSQWSFDNFLAIEGNSNKTEADFIQFTWDMFQSKLQNLYDGVWREGGGGGKRGDAIFVEMRQTLQVIYGVSEANAKKTWKTRDHLKAVCWEIVKAKFVSEGRKHAKQNVDYGSEKLFDQLEVKATNLVAIRKEGLDFDLNDIA